MLHQYWGALLILFAEVSVIQISMALDTAAIRNVIDVTHSSSHLPQVAVTEGIPYPHSETLHSYETNPPSPCSHARHERYRRADAVCNNLRHPFQGAALDTERRLFSNTFLDGQGFPRIHSRNFKELPSAREASSKCFGHEEDNDGNGKNRFATQLVWQFGQLLAHDITHVEKVEKGFNMCCDNFNPKMQNAALYRGDYGKHCMPIRIHPADPHFNHSCMIFARSYAADVFGVQEPINAVTSYIDLSTVYGSSAFLQKELRRGVQGLLKTSENGGIDQLPTFGNFPCTRSAQVPVCPAAGDVRVSDQSALGAIHTMFHLEHNRIVRRLVQINPFWDDETLFQEARKILIGIMQKITYDDYLPLLLGKDVAQAFRLDHDFVYDDSVDAGAILDFTTTGLRYGHTLLNTFVKGFRLRELFLEPVNADDLDFRMFPFFQANHSAHEFNNLFTTEILDHLFEGVEVEGFSPHPGPSFDLTALNIQRGREHGIATYTMVRDACFKMLSSVKRLQKEAPACLLNGVYADVEDVDLFVGGVSETPLPGAILGPTFACMAGIQFQRLKFGDRFFFEGEGLEGFTPAQKVVIKRNTLASLICELHPNGYLQRDVFQPVSSSNPQVPCQVIQRERGMNEGLEEWLDISQDRAIRRQFTDAVSCPSGKERKPYLPFH